MPKYEQDYLDGFLQEETEARQSDIPLIETQRHLARWALRFEKYAQSSKNPAYKSAMFEQRRKCFEMMKGRVR